MQEGPLLTTHGLQPFSRNFGTADALDIVDWWISWLETLDTEQQGTCGFVLKSIDER